MATSIHHPQREILPDNVIPTHYRLSLTPDFTTFKFAGRLNVKLDVTKPTRSIVLNALELELHSASVDVGGKSIASKKISLDEEKQIATLDFEDELKVANDATTLSIDFTGILNDKMAGFYRSSYIDKKSNEKKWLATTQMGRTPQYKTNCRTDRRTSCVSLLGIVSFESNPRMNPESKRRSKWKSQPTKASPY
jgi:aminopeptidase 2